MAPKYSIIVLKISLASPFYMISYNILKLEKTNKVGRLKNGTAMAHQFTDEYSLQYAKWLTPCFL